MNKRSLTVSYFCGLAFGLGLGVAGMTQPQRIIGFLDFFGDWDPTLMGTLGGAVLSFGVGFQILGRKLTNPILQPEFALPQRKDISVPLVVGASVFGIGWGLAGFCPGPAVVGAVSGNPLVLIFLIAMSVGLLAGRFPGRQ